LRYWIFVTKPENYKVCVREEVWGVDERYLDTLKLLKLGKDMFIFYVTHWKEFRDVYEISSKPFYDEEPLWPDKLYPWRIKIKRIFQGKVSINEVFDKLLFITNRGKGKGGWSDHFQFSIISIRDEDFALIHDAMKRMSALQLKMARFFVPEKGKQITLELRRRKTYARINKFSILNMLIELCKRFNIDMYKEIGRKRAYIELVNPRNGKEVRISLKESCKRTLEDQCWIGVCFRDYERLEKLPHQSFVILADGILGNYVVIPYNIIQWRNFSNGKSFTVFITKNEEYLLNSKDPYKGIKLKKNTLKDIIKALT